MVASVKSSKLPMVLSISLLPIVMAVEQYRRAMIRFIVLRLATSTEKLFQKEPLVGTLLGEKQKFKYCSEVHLYHPRHLGVVHDQTASAPGIAVQDFDDPDLHLLAERSQRLLAVHYLLDVTECSPSLLHRHKYHLIIADLPGFNRFPQTNYPT